MCVNKLAFFTRLLHFFWGLFFLGCLTGCGVAPPLGMSLCGVDDFILDSYKIKEGKASICALMGKSWGELSPELLVGELATVSDGDFFTVVPYFYESSAQTEAVSRALMAIEKKLGFSIQHGELQLPGIGVIKAEGLTIGGLQEAIKARYEMSYGRCDLFVTCTERKKNRVELAGAIKKDSLPLRDGMRLLDALVEGKIADNSDLFSSVVVRNNEVLPVDFYKLVRTMDQSQNIFLKSGDSIYVADGQESKVFVFGEVGRVTAVSAWEGFVPLKSALTQAGGFTKNASTSSIQVFRTVFSEPKVYLVSFDHVALLSAHSQLLLPGDIVVVNQTPMAEWNQCVSQQMPSLAIVEAFSKSCKAISFIVP